MSCMWKEGSQKQGADAYVDNDLQRVLSDDVRCRNQTKGGKQWKLNSIHRYAPHANRVRGC